MSEKYKNTWGEPAKQYGFPKLLKALLDGDEAAQRALVASTEQVPCYACSGGQVTCSHCGGSGRVLE